MKLSATVVVQAFEFEDASGYGYRVEATRDPEFGWDAVVSMRSGGAKTPEAAVLHLRSAAEHFLRQLNGLEKPEVQP